MFSITDLWRENHPGANVGCMVVRKVQNFAQCERLEACKRKLEADLCQLFSSREQLSANSIIMRYEDYYKRYKKTYHVRQQIETIVLKGKQIPSIASLVEAMFMAELKNCLLTAGHDYDTLQMPLYIKVGTGNENYILFNGKEHPVKKGDMMIADTAGVISSVIHGPDSRTRITQDTKKALFIVYTPEGIPPQAVYNHLDDIYFYIKLFSPEAEIEMQQVYTA